jgi:hypothetical protein
MVTNDFVDIWEYFIYVRFNEIIQELSVNLETIVLKQSDTEFVQNYDLPLPD